MQEAKLRPLVADDRFILAARDAGYRGLAAAVAELVDNAVQAGAKDIRILTHEGREASGGPRARHVTIAVLDDGRGMGFEELWTALQFGGTERFNDRSGLGRFGMGLPNSSVSITRRLEVYSWRSPREILATYLDVDEVSRRLIGGIPRPVRRSLPSWITHCPPAGTLVVWHRCDRLEFRKAVTIAEKLRKPLGRMYRRLLWKGLRIWVNDVPLDPVDPLFCHPETHAGGAACYGQELRYEVIVPGGSTSSLIAARFTLLPVAAWHSWSTEEKRAVGIIGGAGVSFVRAGREIDHGWLLLGGKRKENYDDWWRCEILFEPDLDECFGVTHSKQGVAPTPYLRGVLEPDLESIARALNAEVRSTFRRLRESEPSRATVQANRNDRLLPLPARLIAAGEDFAYRIVVAPISSAQFIDVEIRGRSVILTLNSDHPFYDRLFSVFPKTSDSRRAIELILLAAGRGYAALSAEERRVTQRYWSVWGDALSAFSERPR